jgi:hypothetical protein
MSAEAGISSGELLLRASHSDSRPKLSAGQGPVAVTGATGGVARLGDRHAR